MAPACVSKMVVYTTGNLPPPPKICPPAKFLGSLARGGMFPNKYAPPLQKFAPSNKIQFTLSFALEIVKFLLKTTFLDTFLNIYS